VKAPTLYTVTAKASDEEPHAVIDPSALIAAKADLVE
jgi:hypothetical protein